MDEEEKTLGISPYCVMISSEEYRKLVESNMKNEYYKNNIERLNNDCLKYEKLYNDYHKKSQLLAKHYNDLVLILTKGSVHPKRGYKFKNNEIIDKDKLAKIVNEKYVIGNILILDDPDLFINHLVREGEEEFYEE